MSRRIASNAQSDHDSVLRRPSRFTDHSASLPRWQSAHELPRQSYHAATIAEETEFTGISEQHDGTRMSRVIGRTRTATLPRHTRFDNTSFPSPSRPRNNTAAAPSGRDAKPAAAAVAMYDITETSHVTVVSSVGEDATGRSIHLTKRSDDSRGGLAETAHWLYARRHDAAEDMRQRLERLRAHVPAPERDPTTRGGSAARARPARLASTRFRQIVNVPVPPEEDEIYGALQRIEERLDALEEVTGTQAPPARSGHQPMGSAAVPAAGERDVTELSRIEDVDAQSEAAAEPNITELSRVEVEDSDGGDFTQLEPFNTEQLEDLRRRIEEEYEPQPHERRPLGAAKSSVKANTKANTETGKDATLTRRSVGTAAGKAAASNKPPITNEADGQAVGATKGTTAAAHAEPAARPVASKPTANARAGRAAERAAPASASASPSKKTGRTPAAKQEREREPAAVRLARLYRSVEAEHFELCAELATASDRLIGRNPARIDEPGLAVDTERVRRLAELVAAKKRQLRLAH